MQFCAMGTLFSSDRVELSSSEEYDSSEESDCHDSEKGCMEGDHCMDALETLQPTIRLTELLTNITLEKLQEIEKDLDTYEKVSLIYLLYDIPGMALQYIQTLLENAKFDTPHSILTEWIKSGSGSDVKNKLIESFCIIQNYEVLRKLGFEKNEVNTRFAPLHGKGLFVNVVRKYLYRVCEDFDTQQTSKFVEFLRRDLREKKVECNLEKFDATYLEMHLLELELAKYITCSDVRNIARIFKYMDLDILYDKFARLTAPRDLEIDNRPLNSLAPLHDVRERKPPKQRTYVENEPKNFPISENYDMDPNKPGILFIINNVNFYTEFRKEYQKFTRSDVKLETRHGSEADEKRLAETFKTFGFEVKVSKNLTHNVLIEELEDVVQEVTDESSLFVAIMSHGIEGEVYGANSVSIKISTLQDIICSSRPLRGRPKVLILQSCQGLKCQELDDEMECDGPTNAPANPKTADMLVFYATVPGYGAIRHKKDGSWFIQALCETMVENKMKHFQDICVHVQSAVVAKRWGQKVMVPEMKSTLSKFLYLPK